MNSIKYTQGDATSPEGEGNKIIVHICNDIGGWGKGFVMALSKKWKEPENQYRAWHLSQNSFELGEVQFVNVEDDIFVANMIGQHSVRSVHNLTPIRYDAVEKCLEKVAQFALENNCSIHMPRIGCGLAGGKWEEIEIIINKTLLIKDIHVTVYDF